MANISSRQTISLGYQKDFDQNVSKCYLQDLIRFQQGNTKYPQRKQ